ncbi:hypothetical protein ACIBO6_23050 [Streptomyces luteogriseus]
MKVARVGGGPAGLCDRAAGQLEPLRRFKPRLGPKVARTVHARSLASRE